MLDLLMSDLEICHLPTKSPNLQSPNLKSNGWIVNREELKARTKAFAVRVVKMTEALPKTRAADIVARQVIRSATSVGANYRAACRGRSHREFTAKIGVVAEEADESLYWLEILVETGLMSEAKLKDLIQEADELTAIFTAASHTARQNRDRRK